MRGAACKFCDERGPSLNARVEFKRGSDKSERVTELPMLVCAECAHEFARVFSLEGGQRPLLAQYLQGALDEARDNRPELEL